MTALLVSCSWCHETNDVTRFRICATCGHRADLPRMDCDCERCSAPAVWPEVTS